MEYKRIDESKGTDVNKTNESYRCIIYNYYYFFKINFRFQPKLYDACHNLMQKAKRFNDLTILSAKGNAFRIGI